MHLHALSAGCTNSARSPCSAAPSHKPSARSPPLPRHPLSPRPLQQHRQQHSRTVLDSMLSEQSRPPSTTLSATSQARPSSATRSSSPRTRRESLVLHIRSRDLCTAVLTRPPSPTQPSSAAVPQDRDPDLGELQQDQVGPARPQAPHGLRGGSVPEHWPVLGRRQGRRDGDHHGASLLSS